MPDALARIVSSLVTNVRRVTVVSSRSICTGADSLSYVNSTVSVTSCPGVQRQRHGHNKGAVRKCIPAHHFHPVGIASSPCGGCPGTRMMVSENGRRSGRQPGLPSGRLLLSTVRRWSTCSSVSEADVSGLERGGRTECSPLHAGRIRKIRRVRIGT